MYLCQLIIQIQNNINQNAENREWFHAFAYGWKQTANCKVILLFIIIWQSGKILPWNNIKKLRHVNVCIRFILSLLKCREYLLLQHTINSTLASWILIHNKNKAVVIIILRPRSRAAPGGSLSILLSHWVMPFRVAHFWPLYTNLTSSVQPEIHNPSQRRQKRTGL